MLRLIIKTFKYLCLLWVLLLMFSPVALMLWGVEKTPSITGGKTMNYGHVTRFREIMETHNPQRMKAGEIKSLVTAEEDLNLVLDYALSHIEETTAKVDVEQGRAFFQLSANLQALNLDGYLNLSMQLGQGVDELLVEKVRIGSIHVPDWISRNLSRYAHWLLLNYQQYQDSMDAIIDFQLRPDEVLLVYEWQPRLVKELAVAHRELFSSEEDKARLLFYQQKIIEVSERLSYVTSLTPMFKPLFEMAYQRSDTANQAVAENRALLRALSMYIAGYRMGDYLGDDSSRVQARLKRRYLTLARRHDLAKHFLISAYLSDSAGKGIADALGLFKEFKDSQGGTGFSFADLAADKAGTRFAQLASSPESARKLQEVIRSAEHEGVFMPDIKNLPEGIQELEFKSRYGSLDSSEYQIIENEIQRRLNNCIAFRT